jgi:hypothetical protein
MHKCRIQPETISNSTKRDSAPPIQSFLDKERPESLSGTQFNGGNDLFHIRVTGMKHILILISLTFQVYAQPVVYPLHIGDTWQYRNSAIMTTDTTICSYKAVSDTVIGGKTYTVIFSGNFPVSYLRQSGDSVYSYRSGFGKEFLYFDFSRPVGDTVSSTAFGSDTTDVVLTQSYTANYFGTPRRAWIFAVNQSRMTMDDEYSVYVADSLGIVQTVPGFGDPQSLIGAVINGRVYGSVVGVRDGHSIAPNRFVIDQNFPNPFNPTTTIRFSLPQASAVAIDVYNGIGQLIRKLDYARMPAGSHNVLFDAAALPSGIYYYRVKTIFGVKAGKMVLEK